MKKTIGTRGSDLALWQANTVQGLLEKAHPGDEFPLDIIETRGDKDQTHALYRPDASSVGLFTKKIEQILIAEKIDIAVHSLKDLPTENPDGLVLGATPVRADVHDVWITRNGTALEDLPSGATVGTSSLRRRAFINRIRDDLELVDIRGNVPTRLQMLEDGKYDAIVLAKAGLVRLGLLPAQALPLPLDSFLPAPGQGAVGVQVRGSDRDALELVGAISDRDVEIAVTAERAFLQKLEGGCHVPLGSLARIDGEMLTVRGLVVSLSGQESVEGERSQTLPDVGDFAGRRDTARKLGRDLAEDFLAKGAQKLMELDT